MQQYKDLVQYILDHGRVKSDRTGVGTKSIFGYQTRFNLSDGFPLVTLKKTYFHAVVVELIAFIKGVTNNQFFLDHNVHIWDEWAVPEDVYDEVVLTHHERIELRAEMQNIPVVDSARRAFEDDYTVEKLGLNPTRGGEGVGLNPHSTTKPQASLSNPDANGSEKMLDEEGVPRTKKVLRARAGDLGPIYGSQWRSWPNYRDGGAIDQLKEAIELLKTKPTSRRIIVSAWNPADLPDESKKPHVNAAEGKMCLAACHTMFQFMAEPLTLAERLIEDATFIPIVTEEAIKVLQSEGRVPYANFITTDISDFDREVITVAMDSRGIPKYRLSCQLYQRSCDTAIGLPFNIASYALLTMMVAQCVNMVPGDFVWTGGDVHLYLNHLEANGAEKGIETMMQREPLPLPTVLLNPDVKNIDDFKIEDIKLVGYQSHPAIKFPIAV